MCIPGDFPLSKKLLITNCLHHVPRAHLVFPLWAKANLISNAQVMRNLQKIIVERAKVAKTLSVKMTSSLLTRSLLLLNFANSTLQSVNIANPVNRPLKRKSITTVGPLPTPQRPAKVIKLTLRPPKPTNADFPPPPSLSLSPPPPFLIPHHYVTLYNNVSWQEAKA